MVAKTFSISEELLEHEDAVFLRTNTSNIVETFTLRGTDPDQQDFPPLTMRLSAGGTIEIKAGSRTIYAINPAGSCYVDEENENAVAWTLESIYEAVLGVLVTHGLTAGKKKNQIKKSTSKAESKPVGRVTRAEIDRLKSDNADLLSEVDTLHEEYQKQRKRASNLKTQNTNQANKIKKLQEELADYKITDSIYEVDFHRCSCSECIPPKATKKKTSTRKKK